jgi:hypothetical protein
MAKLSIGGPDLRGTPYEGNAARKLSPREVEDNHEDEALEIEKAEIVKPTPVSERKRKPVVSQGLNFEDQEREEALTRLRKRMGTMKEKEAPKTAKALEQQGEEGDLALSEKRKTEGLSEAFAETLKKRRAVSAEEARQLLPHGDRVFELVSQTLAGKEEESEGNMAKGIQLAIEVERDELFTGQKYDLASEYVRILAKYRKAVESGDDGVRQKTLEKLTRINRTLGIPLNAEIESNLEKEDLGFAREQMKIDQAQYAAKELEADAKEVADMPMDVERIKKYNLVKRPADLWDNLTTLLPKGKENLATEYVLTLARVNEASRGVNLAAYDKANAALERMNVALGIQGRADIMSETLPRPGEKYENPFGA